MGRSRCGPPVVARSLVGGQRQATPGRKCIARGVLDSPKAHVNIHRMVLRPFRCVILLRRPPRTPRNGRRTISFAGCACPVLRCSNPQGCSAPVLGQASPANELDGRGFLRCHEWSVTGGIACRMVLSVLPTVKTSRCPILKDLAPLTVPFLWAQTWSNRRSMFGRRLSKWHSTDGVPTPEAVCLTSVHAGKCRARY